jgi:hypothetical protein
MPLNYQQIQERINNIHKCSNRNSKFYGKLLNWYSDGAWHYGIGLSDDHLFDLGDNLNTFHKKDRQVQLVSIRQYPPDKMIQRLIHALSCFKDWHYGLLGWNCEHYSRLVATNDAICYQVKNSPLAFLNHGGYHPTAVQMLTDYLNHLGKPELTSFENEEIKEDLSQVLKNQENFPKNNDFYPVQGLLETIIYEVYSEYNSKEEEKLKKANLISNQHLRDSYIKQLLSDQFIFLTDTVRSKIQNVVKHAHYIAEVVIYYHNDHGATQEEAKEISRQFQVLALKISQVQSLYDLKIVYQVVTAFSYHLSRFKHRERKYSWQREIRKGMLEPLGDCISQQT